MVILRKNKVGEKAPFRPDQYRGGLYWSEKGATNSKGEKKESEGRGQHEHRHQRLVQLLPREGARARLLDRYEGETADAAEL